MLAAKGGDINARHNLGTLEYKEGNYDLTLKHLHISAAAGHEASVDWTT